MKNVIDYNTTVIIKSVKCFIVQAPVHITAKILTILLMYSINYEPNMFILKNPGLIISENSNSKHPTIVITSVNWIVHEPVANVIKLFKALSYAFS